MNEYMDKGDIIYINEIAIQNDNLKSLHDKLAQLSAKTILDTLTLDYKTMLQKQNENDASYCHKISASDYQIDFSKSFDTIINKINAFSPKPGAYFICNNKKIIITNATIIDSKIKIITLKPEGKKEMLYTDYRLGNPNPKPEIFHD